MPLLIQMIFLALFATHVLAVPRTALGVIHRPPPVIVIDDFTQDPKDVVWPKASNPPHPATEMWPTVAPHTSGVPRLSTCSLYRQITVEQGAGPAFHHAEAIEMAGFPWEPIFPFGARSQLCHGEVADGRFYATVGSVKNADFGLVYTSDAPVGWGAPPPPIPLDLNPYTFLRIQVERADGPIGMNVRISDGDPTHKSQFVNGVLTGNVFTWKLDALAHSLPGAIPVDLGHVTSIEVGFATRSPGDNGFDAILKWVKVTP